MQNKDTYHNAYTWYTHWNGSTYSDGPWNVIHDHVATGSVVHGNMHDPNPWSYDVWIRKNWTGRRIDVYYGYGNIISDGSFTCLEFGLPAWEQSVLYNMALSRLYDELRGGLDLGVDLAEAGQTRRMFRGLREAEALARTVGSGISKTAANGWLEFQYGWRPLYQDLFGAANEMLNHVLNTLKKFRVTASLPLWGNETFLNQTGWTVHRNTSGKQACTIVCTFEIPGFSLDRFSSLNPISLGWELIPYSFVVDWVLDIGSFLRSFETMLLYGARWKSGYSSEIYHVRQHLTMDGVVLGGNPQQRICDSNDAFWNQTSFRRTVLSGVPAPRIPSIHAQMGWQRWLSAGSLMSQVIHR